MRSDRGLTDLAAGTFLLLRQAFAMEDGQARTFPLRDKRNTQDDPLDEHIGNILRDTLPQGVSCIQAPGPLITPDMVVLRREECASSRRMALRDDLTRIFGLEVKKLERTAGGGVARASGLDYNTTPPCGTIRIYDARKRPLDIRGFYLFVCREGGGQPESYRLSALVLCDGNLLNDDFAYYLSVVGERIKALGLGSYADGADRSRPMVIFPNPLGVRVLDHAVTLIHPRGDLSDEFDGLRLVGTIRRSHRDRGERVFCCYRYARDVTTRDAGFDLVEPFPTPERQERTQARGRFRIDVEPID